MESNNQIYMEYDVDQKIVEAKLTRLSMMYQCSKRLHQMLRQMLIYDPVTRPDFMQLANWMPEKSGFLQQIGEYQNGVFIDYPEGFQPEFYKTKQDKYQPKGPQLDLKESDQSKNAIGQLRSNCLHNQEQRPHQA